MGNRWGKGKEYKSTRLTAIFIMHVCAYVKNPGGSEAYHHGNRSGETSCNNKSHRITIPARRFRPVAVVLPPPSCERQRRAFPRPHPSHLSLVPSVDAVPKRGHPLRLRAGSLQPHLKKREVAAPKQDLVHRQPAGGRPSYTQGPLAWQQDAPGDERLYLFFLPGR